MTVHSYGHGHKTIRQIKAELNDARTWQIEVDGDLDTINDIIDRQTNRDGVIGGGAYVGEGSTDTTMVRLNGVCRYSIGGQEFVTRDQEIDLVGTDDVTQAKFGAWRIMAGKTGVISTQRATANGTSGVMAFNSAEDALLSLSQIARTANTVDVGYLVIEAAAGGFTPQTDDPVTSDAAVTAATYYDARVPHLDNGFTAAPSVGLSEGTNDDEFAFGTIDVRTNGVNVAQIAADTTIAFADADVITTSGKYGGHLFVTDLAGTGVMSLSQTGIAGSAQTVDSASAAVVGTALDAVQLALPTLFTVIGREVTVTAKATFTYNTDDLAGTDGTATWTDEVVTAFDRTDKAGTGVGPTPPTIPGTVTAPYNDQFTDPQGTP